MGWITERPSQYHDEETYWLPECFPDPTEEQKSTQLNKFYLKPDQTITPHPGWFYPNQAKVCDEYFYYNYEWLTIIDEKPDEHDGENTFHIVECPISEWEKIDEEPYYKIKKKYKKYLYDPQPRPEWRYNLEIVHSYDYDDENMIASDNYTVEELSETEKLRIESKLFDELRKIRDYFLQKTDYITNISRERNLVLSEEFISYRQRLRDIPNSFDISTLGDSKFNSIRRLFVKVSIPDNDLTEINNYLLSNEIADIVPSIPSTFFEE